MPALVGVVAVFGWWGLWPIRWLSLPAAAFPEAAARYRAEVAAVAEAAPVGSFVHTGHRGGSFEEYAKTLHAGRPPTWKPVTALMDRAFDTLGLTAIEVDLRPSPLDDRAVVVVHDPVDGARLDDAGRRYVERSTVRRVVRAFLDRGRHRRGQRLVFEIKAPREGLDEASRQTVDRLARALNELLGGRPDEALARGALDLISFNHGALVRLHRALGPTGAGHGLFLIVTSNQFPEWVFRLGPQPPFSAGLQARLREVPWLRGVYFDPRFVDGFARLFNGISEDRQARGLRPLELHLSTFSYRLGDLVDRLADQPERLRHVRGLIYEIRRR